MCWQWILAARADCHIEFLQEMCSAWTMAYQLHLGVFSLDPEEVSPLAAREGVELKPNPPFVAPHKIWIKVSFGLGEIFGKLRKFRLFFILWLFLVIRWVFMVILLIRGADSYFFLNEEMVIWADSFFFLNGEMVIGADSFYFLNGEKGLSNILGKVCRWSVAEDS
jgi:hypothetical protein